VTASIQTLGAADVLLADGTIVMVPEEV